MTTINRQKLIKKVFDYLHQNVYKEKNYFTERHLTKLYQPLNKILAKQNSPASFDKKPFDINQMIGSFITINKSANGQDKSNSKPKNKLDELNKQVSQCQLCQLSKHKKRDISYSNSPDKKLLILLDKPEYYDQMAGKILSGEVGELSSKILAAINRPLKLWNITCCFKCPGTDELPEDLSPYTVCLNYLKQELAVYQPSLILAMGEKTYQALMTNDYFSRCRGKKMQYLNYPIVFTEHPRELVMDPGLKKGLWEDIKWLKKIE